MAIAEAREHGQLQFSPLPGLGGKASMLKSASVGTYNAPPLLAGAGECEKLKYSPAPSLKPACTYRQGILLLH